MQPDRGHPARSWDFAERAERWNGVPPETLAVRLSDDPATQRRGAAIAAVVRQCRIMARGSTGRSAVFDHFAALAYGAGAAAAPAATIEEQHAMSPATPAFPTLLRVYFPFAIAYVASYLFRGVNAVLFPYLERDLGVGAGDLGLLTAAYFFFFAGCQPVLGIALDRYGPRKVQVVLLLVAGLGALVFGLSQGLAQLVTGRALIGLGCAAGLMAAIKAITMWFPPDRWPLMTGLHMAAGGVGYMAATRPVEWSLALTTWQGLFFWLAAFCVVVAVLMLLVVPERAPGGKPGSLRQQLDLTWLVLRDAFFWRIIPLLAVQQIAYIAVLFLWIGPWL